jgi:hypothetical protein
VWRESGSLERGDDRAAINLLERSVAYLHDHECSSQ